MNTSEKSTVDNDNVPIYKESIEKINGSRKKSDSTPDESKKRLDIIKLNENPHHFICDGIKVRVSYEGTADLNELIKGLFLAG